MRRLLRFAALAAVLIAALGASGAALAQSLDELRAQGIVGERFDGYLVARQSTPTANKVVAEVNAQRRSIYAQRATNQGVPAAQVGQVYAAQIMRSAPKGTWFQAANGSWTRK